MKHPVSPQYSTCFTRFIISYVEFLAALCFGLCILTIVFIPVNGGLISYFSLKSPSTEFWFYLSYLITILLAGGFLVEWLRRMMAKSHITTTHPSTLTLLKRIICMVYFGGLGYVYALLVGKELTPAFIICLTFWGGFLGCFYAYRILLYPPSFKSLIQAVIIALNASIVGIFMTIILLASISHNNIAHQSIIASVLLISLGIFAGVFYALGPKLTFALLLAGLIVSVAIMGMTSAANGLLVAATLSFIIAIFCLIINVVVTLFLYCLYCLY